MLLQNVSIVIIGKNEAENLDLTFAAIDNVDYPKHKMDVIYCDTGSTDKSVEIAKKYTNRVYVDHSPWPAAGLARNRGIVESKYDLIHFIDGDIQIDKSYLKKAVNKIHQPGIDAVYGCLVEKSSRGINKILLSHWKDRAEGFHNATGGGGTYKKQPLLEIDGYDERIRKGQETELGERFLTAGYRIWFINEPMGIHDYGVQKFSDLLKIYFLDGVNKSHLHLNRGDSKFYEDSKRKAFNNLIFSLFMISVLFLSFIFFSQLGLLLFLTIYFSYFAVKYLILKKIHELNKLLYFFMMYSMRFVTFGGQMKFYFKCLLNPGFCKSVIKPKMKLKYEHSDIH